METQTPPKTSNRFIFVINDDEQDWLRAMAYNNKMSQAKVMRLLLRQGALKAGLIGKEGGQHEQPA